MWRIFFVAFPSSLKKTDTGYFSHQNSFTSKNNCVKYEERSVEIKSPRCEFTGDNVVLRGHSSTLWKKIPLQIHWLKSALEQAIESNEHVNTKGKFLHPLSRGSYLILLNSMFLSPFSCLLHEQLFVVFEL